jgi:5-methylcytosine-specific restriction endonuclease McrA
LTAEKTISDLVMEYFQKHPKKDLEHGPVVDYVEERYWKLYKMKPRDTWRQIRRLYQEGKLIKVRKGIYRFDPHRVSRKELQEFTPKTKEEIFRRDGYRCVVCGRGRKDGVEIHADHRVPLEKKGTNDVDNGQTLCSEHNIFKKKYSQTEFGKRFMIRLHQDALKNKDTKMIKFCEDILDIYDQHGIDKHILRS